MKRIIFSLLILCGFQLGAAAQTEVKQTDKKTKIERPHSSKKIKRTSTPKQKVHNIIHPRRKHYSGVKVKRDTKKQ